jgi:hypothetical protein
MVLTFAGVFLAQSCYQSNLCKDRQNNHSAACKHEVFHGVFSSERITLLSEGISPIGGEMLFRYHILLAINQICTFRICILSIACKLISHVYMPGLHC